MEIIRTEIVDELNEILVPSDLNRSPMIFATRNICSLEKKMDGGGGGARV